MSGGREEIRTDAQRDYWDALSPAYAAITRIREDDFHFGPQIPGDRELRILPDLQKTDAGQPQRVGPERRTGREDAHPCIPSQTRRPHRRRPGVSFRLRKLPQQPEMAECLHTPKGFRNTELRLHDDQCLQAVSHPALVRHAEFRGKIRPDMRDGSDLHHKSPSVSAETAA